LSAFVDTNELFKAFKGMWNYFRPNGRILLEDEISELEQNFVEFCAMNMTTVAVDDKRWSHIRAHNASLRSVIQVETFDNWFLEMMMNLTILTERDLGVRTEAETDLSYGSYITEDLELISFEDLLDQLEDPVVRVDDVKLVSMFIGSAVQGVQGHTVTYDLMDELNAATDDAAVVTDERSLDSTSVEELNGDNFYQLFNEE
jgi:hypothetical protein